MSTEESKDPVPSSGNNPGIAPILITPDNPEKFKYVINRLADRETHFNQFDDSFVDYYLKDERGCFDLKFDQILYEPPS